MSTLLPPKVVGPVSVLSPHVYVIGAVYGATVQLLRNGGPIGPTQAADQNGVARITLPGGTLNPGDHLTATQSVVVVEVGHGTHTEVSDPSQFPEPVLGVPASLPPLIYLSLFHTCANTIVLGGAVAGATISVTLNGNEIGAAAADGPEVSVDLAQFQPFPLNSVLHAHQTLLWQGATLQSPPTPSLPVEPGPNPEQTLPAPQIVPPLYECDTSVTVTGILDGATLWLERSNAGNGAYTFAGNSVSAPTLPLTMAETVKAYQSFRPCNLQSPTSAPVDVVKPTSLPTPIIDGPICRDAKQVMIRELIKGATVTVQAGRNTAMGWTEMWVGQANAAGSEQPFDLPSTLPSFPPDGPAQYLRAAQDRCR